ncbi:MAG: bifunctional (p)ppGpp synthetase/guanosine-3',5'-bis(diphosphate) 3'-pyrophosphohydrolase [Oscillospiraceae bacterium]|nr:bifunctional (p)ppGpp synthetase/guanosine-3',5'-bis(diphosphate) 3'-pyrophosphohydrolase [Oscillospiraceae bacterium]
MIDTVKNVILEPEKIPQRNIKDTDKLIEEIIDMVNKYNPNANTDMIYIAYRFAKNLHEGQKRKSGDPYIIHPVEVAYIAAQLALDSTAITACLLHDVVEDTACTYDDVTALFGTSVAELVDGVTKLRQIKYTSREEQQVENLRKMFLAMSKDIRVVIIKLIDRLHNMRTMNFMPRHKQLRISKETLDVYAPLAHRLGIAKIKIELEDLALKYLDPVAYEEIRESINQKKSARDKYIADIMDILRQKLEDMDINGTITGRAKHFYSIWRKMYTQNKTIDSLYDLFAVRVIVDSIQDCYAVLGMVHDLYTPVPMRFKDYIAMPKPNMYQSLHTTVIGPNGTPFEIQIRTWEMHHVAENGIAAHWKYKEGKNGETEMDSKLEWVRTLLDTQQNIIDSDEFFNTLKFDLFSDEVFVFTPQGRVISLPANSTVIDFAFAIHSEVGYKMSGAKINGKIVPNNYQLVNGEIVEILTSNQHGPSRDWLKICKTSRARNKINQWFKRERRDENIVEGKDAIEHELKRLGHTHAQLFRTEWVPILLKKYGFNTLDDLYAAVGYGGLTAGKVVMRLREELLKEIRERERQTELKKMIEQEPQKQPEPEKKSPRSSNGIIVKGIENCLVRLARCCNPVAGDDIVGFITKGRGVSVHRADCTNVMQEHLSMEDRARLIDVTWDAERASTYDANVRITGQDRDGMLLDVTGILITHQVPFRSANAYVTKSGEAVIEVGIQIKNTSDLAKITKLFKQLPGVETVTRSIK